MNSFDKIYFKIITENCHLISEVDRTTKIIAKVGGGLLGMFLGSKIGEFAGEKLGGMIGAKYATEKATEQLGETAIKRAMGELPIDKGFKGIGQAISAGTAKAAISAGKSIGSSIGSTTGKAAGIVGGTYLGAKTGDFLEEKLNNAINSSNHDSWFITMTKDGKQLYLTLNSKELVSSDPTKAAVLSKNDGFNSDKDVQEKLEKDGVFEALKEFKNIQIVGFEKSKLN